MRSPIKGDKIQQKLKTDDEQVKQNFFNDLFAPKTM